jgi:hypothetical protein
MIKAQSAIVPFWYTPKSETDADVKTRFQLRGLTGIQKAGAFNEPSPGARLRAILQYGLLRWENLIVSDGSEIKDVSAFEVLDILPETLIYELANQIIEATNLGEQEKKH